MPESTDRTPSRWIELLATLSGGRPMNKVIYAFRDVVKHRPIFIFRDYFGRYWMAEHSWSLSRVQTTHEPEIWRKP